MTPASPAVAPARRRPRDRRTQLASTAARLFCDLGYHRVGVGDVAAAVDITARAVYRHFGNKHELLAHVVIGALDALDACFEGSADETVAALATVAVEQRHVGLLIERESLHLMGPDRDEVERRRRALVERLRAFVMSRRADLDPADAELVAWWTLAVVCSPSWHTASTPHAHSTVGALVHQVLATGALPRRTAPRVDAPATPWTAATRVSRRELILAAAISLFAERGYADVRMEDIGAAAGIAGPSIYQYFAGKTEILFAALTRGAEWLQLGMATALSAARRPGDAISLVVRSYIDFLLDHTELMSVLLTETIYLDDDERHAIRRVQHDYVAQWAGLLVDLCPEMTSGDARFRLHGALGLINDTVRRGRGGERPDLADLLQEAGLELLGVNR